MRIFSGIALRPLSVCSIPWWSITTGYIYIYTSSTAQGGGGSFKIDMRCFVHFHFQMCVSPQRRAFFRHPTFEKCSEPVSFNIFTSKCAFRHSGVEFLISPLSSYLRTRRFNRPTFGLTRHANHWKNTAFRDFSNIWHGCIFFLLTFALLHLLPSDLTACLLCFSTLHIVGSLLFKLPSINILYNKYTQCIWIWACLCSGLFPVLFYAIFSV